MKAKIRQTLPLIAIFFLVILAIWSINYFGIQRLRANLAYLGIWGPLGLFTLRFLSVVIPALPGTAYSLLAGALFGFNKGLLVICLADFASCTLSFYLSRQYGRDFIERLVGHRFMSQVDHLSKQHLESNFFLMSAFLMTGFFDFVSYGVGLTKTSWMVFLPALLMRLAVSNPPIVALGAGILEGGKKLLGFALIGVFVLAIITGIVQQRLRKKQNT
ncbi:SNARE associated Golgi protein [Rippkaea orientalis PCC 8801]|uniref:TVP38/TMEM64 family membrane protein n=1 Tax=Rippkaea orientalis (strain PCC 8801 / RF-1) TaxID=41431 RepID=B7JZU6_RIPO1|nr:VTT domain-containing protein [Rippkaea orientalis]ACK65039.1 SNARE associated Golgi protein [Rippkaea orientalis PCC 8801]